MSKLEELKNTFCKQSCRDLGEREYSDVDEKYAVDLGVLKELDLKGERPQRLVSTRKIHYKNEYHDEELTQVQLTVFDNLFGLGTVKEIGKQVLDALGKEAEGYTLRPSFVYQVVPAIELIENGVRFASGGMVRPEILKKMGLNVEKDSICTIMFIVEEMEKF